MQTYELTYIISSQISQEKAQQMAKEIETAIQNKGGIIIKSNSLMAKTLAYPIYKQSSGYVSTLDFQLPQENVLELQGQLVKDGHILRINLTVKKPLKIAKERRSRKPLGVFSKEKTQETSPYKHTADTSGATKAGMEDIDKKLDELLN